MAAADAQLLWLSAKVPNDQFLLFAFDGVPGDVDQALAEVRRRAMGCNELRLRVVDDRWWSYPRWVPAGVADGQFLVHEPGQWQDCLDCVRGLTQLDITRMCWRLHVFPDVDGIPSAGRGAVLVVQIAHALGDGTRASQLAAVLLGRDESVGPVRASAPGLLPWRAAKAAAAHRQLERDVAAGLVPGPGAPRPALSVNAATPAASALRTMAVPRSRLPGPTVTVGALVAVAEALGGYLVERGEDVTRLGAEVPISHRRRLAHNNFRNVGIELHPGLDRGERALRIAAQLAAQRRRGDHPAERASAEAFAAVPASLLRWGVGLFDSGARSSVVSGHTVVSSVNRGPADLSFGGHQVVLTAGYPALSPMMGLTHGVHGIGDTVAISVHADPGVVDLDDYVGRLARALASGQG